MQDNDVRFNGTKLVLPWTQRERPYLPSQMDVGAAIGVTMLTLFYTSLYRWDSNMIAMASGLVAMWLLGNVVREGICWFLEQAFLECIVRPWRWLTGVYRERLERLRAEEFHTWLADREAMIMGDKKPWEES